MNITDGFARWWSAVRYDTAARRRMVMWFLLIVFAALLIRASIEWMRGEPERYPHEYVRQFTLLLGEIALCAGVLARERSWLRRLLISVTFALLLVNSYFTYFAR